MLIATVLKKLAEFNVYVLVIILISVVVSIPVIPPYSIKHLVESDQKI